jgi:hypothetical protein
MTVHLIAPDILEPLRTVSSLYLALGVVVGLLLWSLGGWGHRFWLVLGTTMVAGICGLIWGPHFGMQPLVAGLFLGVALGALALSLVRILMFLASGVLAVWLARLIAPNWNETVACFLVGGVVGILLFRVWITVLTSFLGSMLILYNGLALADRITSLDAVHVTTQNGPLLNWTCAGLTAAGVLVQYLILRRGSGSSGGNADDDFDSSSRSWVFWWPWKGEVKKAG